MESRAAGPTMRALHGCKFADRRRLIAQRRHTGGSSRLILHELRAPGRIRTLWLFACHTIFIGAPGVFKDGSVQLERSQRVLN